MVRIGYGFVLVHTLIGLLTALPLSHGIRCVQETYDLLMCGYTIKTILEIPIAIEQSSIECQKLSGIASILLCYRCVIGPENSRYPLNQSDVKRRNNTTWSPAFSRAFGIWFVL